MNEPDRWEGLVDAAEKEEAKRAAAASAPRVRTRAMSLWGAFGASVLALAASWLVVSSNSPGPGAQALEAGRKLALSIAAGMVHDFVLRTGRYPDTLGEAMPLELEIRYRKLDDGFELAAVLPDGRTLIVKER